MLDANNDQLSSELTGDDASKKNEKTTDKAVEKGSVVDDNQKEDAVVENTETVEDKTETKDVPVDEITDVGGNLGDSAGINKSVGPA